MNHKKINGFAIFLWAVLFMQCPIKAHSQYFTGPISQGAGGGGVASVDPAESVFLNPAILAHVKGGAGGVFYSDGYIGHLEHDNVLAATLVDGGEDVFVPGSLSYLQRRRTFNGLTAVEENYWQASVGGFVFDHFAFGLAVTRLEQKPDRGLGKVQWNGVLGLHYNPIPDFGMGLVYYNVFGAEKQMAAHIRRLPKVTLGFNFLFSDFVRTRIDFSRVEDLNPDKKMEFHGGVESFISDFLIFRLGGGWDNRQDRNTISMGFGFNGPRLKVNYSFVKPTKGTNGALHSIDFNVGF